MVEGSVQVEQGGEKPPPGVSPREDRPYLRPLRPTPWGALGWVVAVAALVIVGAIAYYVWRSSASEPLPGPPRAESPAAPAPAATAPAPPAIQHPLATPASPEPLPALAESDGAMREALARLLGGDGLALLEPERVISRIVVTIDNLPRRSVPARMLPLKPAPGAFETEGGAAIGAGNAARYASYVRLVQAIDAKACVDLYVRFYPLFEKAYAQLGDPRGYFNDRVVAAIDDLLAAPDLKEPPALTRPKVYYEFADPQLESRSAGQKLMLRMGAENAGKVKAKLREIRAELDRHRAR